MRLETTLRTSWDRALQIFRFYAPTVPYTDKGIEALETMRRSVGAKAEIMFSGNSENMTGSTSVMDSLSSADTDLAWDPGCPRNSETWDEVFSSNDMDQVWLTSLDFGEDNWMLRLPGDIGDECNK